MHGRPVPWGLNDPMPALLKNMLTKTLIQIEGNRARSLPHILPEFGHLISSFRQGYRVLLYTKIYPRYKAEQVEQLLTALYGIPKSIKKTRFLLSPYSEIRK